MASRRFGLRGRTLTTTPLRAIVVIAALAVAASSATIALGAVADSGTVTTCFSKATGTWRPIDTAAGLKCKAGEQQLTFYTKEKVDSLIGSLNFLTQTQADGRYLGISAQAADADKLDGKDSTAFLPFTNCIGYPHTETDWHGCDLHGANLSGAFMNHANLSGAHLQGANLTGANLSGADLSGADLSFAYLNNASLDSADLTDANLTAADLTGVTWNSTTCPDGTNSTTNGNTCEGHL